MLQVHLYMCIRLSGGGTWIVCWCLQPLLLSNDGLLQTLDVLSSNAAVVATCKGVSQSLAAFNLFFGICLQWRHCRLLQAHDQIGIRAQ
jgi:hypothetical protein